MTRARKNRVVRGLRMFRSLKILMTLLAAHAMVATAATRTWTGGGDGVTWTDPANWGGTMPTAGDKASFALSDTLTFSSNSSLFTLLYVTSNISPRGIWSSVR